MGQTPPSEKLRWKINETRQLQPLAGAHDIYYCSVSHLERAASNMILFCLRSVSMSPDPSEGRHDLKNTPAVLLALG